MLKPKSRPIKVGGGSLTNRFDLPNYSNICYLLFLLLWKVNISSVQTQIEKVEADLAKTEDPTEKIYLRDEKKQLLDKENKLLDKENKLRDEKNLLIQQLGKYYVGVGEILLNTDRKSLYPPYFVEQE